MSLEWHIIPTGQVWVDPGGPFGLVPRALWSKHQTPNENQLVPMSLNCLLIFSDGKTILVDNGMGSKLDEKGVRQWGLHYPEGNMLDNLAKHGVRPEDIDIVLDTHLHSDHCSGNTTFANGKVVPTFPNAEYWVQRVEWADAMHPDARTRATYLLENYVPVWEAGKFRLLHGNTQLTKDVRCVVTPGHTRGLQCILLEGGSRPVFYITDLASYAVHIERLAWVTAYDVEPLETIRTKAHWQKWLFENKALIVFEHDTTMPIGELVKDDEGKFKVKRAEFAIT